jgi:hypothetical protein
MSTKWTKNERESVRIACKGKKKYTEMPPAYKRKY